MKTCVISTEKTENTRLYRIYRRALYYCSDGRGYLEQWQFYERNRVRVHCDCIYSVHSVK